MGIYLSPIFYNILPQHRAEFGYIEGLRDGGTRTAITKGYNWMLDNGVFSGVFSRDKWVAKLERLKSYSNTCLGVVVPDVLTRHDDGAVQGDWQATVAQFEQYAPIVREYGYPVAFVSQDGLPLEAAPWADFEVLFVGGSDHHKLTESWPLITEAKRRGKWVHIGRVNSAKRIALFWMADSWDGTMLAREPSASRQMRILRAARRATIYKECEQGGLLDALCQPLSCSHCAGEPIHGDVRP